jgi:tetratricopeptide (TPR) repeat protein
MPEPRADAGKPAKPEPTRVASQRKKSPVSRAPKRSDPEPVVKTPPTSSGDAKQAEIYIRAGRDHLKRGSHSKAKAAFDQAYAYDPTSAAALAGLGEVAFEQGNYAEATAKLRAALRLDFNSRYLTLLGSSYFKQGKYRLAIEQYKRALRLAPGNREASEGLKAAKTKLRGG